MQEIIRLEQSLMGSVWESRKHASGVEVPDGCATHDVQPKRPEDGKVDRGVELFHEPGKLVFASDSREYSNWTDEALHEEFACE